MNRQFTAVIQREDDLYVALCPELDVASQGDSVEEVRDNLREAIELFLQEADPRQIQQRSEETPRTVPVPDHKELKPGTLASIIRQAGIPRSAFD